VNGDKCLIEEFLPIKAISEKASREKSIRKGHISTLHLWWARRPLVACRAAVYGTLVPASRFAPNNGTDKQKKSLGHANAAKFVTELCQYPGNPRYIEEARKHILEAHAQRLTKELGRPVTVEDILEGRQPRPKVLDMFAGGGAIPLEALRLGCQAYALELNPVAHIIELCTLVYPQKYGKPDPNARGMTGAPGPDGKPTWGGLAKEVKYWGGWVLEKAKAEIGDLYPPIPDPEFWSGTGRRPAGENLPLFSSASAAVTKTHGNLPHWEGENACYFITWRTAPGVELPPEARSLVLDNLKYWDGRRYNLWQAVVMPNHVHVLLSALPKEDGSVWSLAEILDTAKSHTADQINRQLGQDGVIWQDERLDHIVRSPASFEEKWHCIRQNPCKAGLAARSTDYQWLYEHPALAARPTLTPVAYLWTRTVRCKNASCGATVPLVRQTWLRKKSSRYVALKMIAPPGEKRVRFEVVESSSENGLGFDPAGFSKGGNATCPFCSTVADSEYVKSEGQAKRMGTQMMAIVCTRPDKKGKIYLSADDYPNFAPDDALIRRRIEELCARTGLTMPTEAMDTQDPTTVAGRGFGISTFAQLFTPRQMLCLLTFAAAVRQCFEVLKQEGVEDERAKAVAVYLAVLVNRQADYNSSLARWHVTGEKISGTFGRQALPMVWDFAELAPFGEGSGSPKGALDWIVGVAQAQTGVGIPASVSRGTATALPYADASFDAVVTDPPYYDNVQYAALSDFFYVWLKRTIGHLFPEHFAAELTPKKNEIVASPWRQGSEAEARAAYERMMLQSFLEAHRVLKSGGNMTVVYAHKTTKGWSTLIDALRRAGFAVSEAWPVETEMKARLIAMESAALASSIFIVARKRDDGGTGSYEDEVQPELQRIVRERVDSLWEMGISGADLVIAAVGAGLRAFTRFARVEYANGDEMPAEKFLVEVECAVLETILEKIFGMDSRGVGTVDGPTRFYVLWRYAYGSAPLDAGEAIVFTYTHPVELDGPRGLSAGSRRLVEKVKDTYKLLDYQQRGDNEKLGLPVDGAPAPIIDVLHRVLWLMEKNPRMLRDFLDQATPNHEHLRLVAQALAGRSLSGRAPQDAGRLVTTTPAEQSALDRLLANWRSVIEQDTLFGSAGG
jgi:putative DNA methylase